MKMLVEQNVPSVMTHGNRIIYHLVWDKNIKQLKILVIYLILVGWIGIFINKSCKRGDMFILFLTVSPVGSQWSDIPHTSIIFADWMSEKWITAKTVFYVTWFSPLNEVDFHLKLVTALKKGFQKSKRERFSSKGNP